MIFNSKVMKLNNADSVPYLTYNSLSEIKFINHAFSTRLGGVSKGEFTSMNLAFNRGDNPDDVTENYKRICRSAGFEFDSLTASAQDHHTFVRAVTKQDRGVGIYKPRDIESVDALITNESGVTLVTYYADCTPLFFVDTKTKAIGLAHAGWRGTVGRIGEKVVKKMTELYGTNPKDIKAAIGPAISVCCYEVDKPCADNFYALEGLDNSKFIFPKANCHSDQRGGISGSAAESIGSLDFARDDSGVEENEKYMIDLLETNRQILAAAGVQPENITVSDVCTNCNSDLLWSHRATKGHRGTMCAFMVIK